MKKLFICIFVFSIAISCSSLSTRTANLWLDSKRGTSADVDISGKWDAGYYMGGGWGVGHFFQTGDKFKGTLSAFNVKGLVNGTTLYMIIKGGNSVYTAKLTPGLNGSFYGQAVYQEIVDSRAAENADVYPISMKRME